VDKDWKSEQAISEIELVTARLTDILRQQGFGGVADDVTRLFRDVRRDPASVANARQVAERPGAFGDMGFPSAKGDAPAIDLNREYSRLLDRLYVALDELRNA